MFISPSIEGLNFAEKVLMNQARTRWLLTAFLVISLSPLRGWGRSLSLYEWHPPQAMAPLILAVRAHESPEQAATRYLEGLMRTPELAELFQGQKPQLDQENFRRLKDSNLEHRALLVANNPRAFQLNYAPLDGLMKAFEASGHQSYILPLNADLGLTTTERAQFFEEIAQRFPLLVPMGGDDVDPSLYDETTTLARSTNWTRDRFELQLIKSYVSKAKGFILGICRGSQLTSVALGYKLNQDLPSLKGTDVPHANHWHPIQVSSTSHQILKSLTRGSDFIHVNSLHHQSVRFQSGGHLELAAVSADGTTEATEFKDGRGLLLQFHPELMNNDLGLRILTKVIEQKNKTLTPRCHRVLQ